MDRDTENGLTTQLLGGDRHRNFQSAVPAKEVTLVSLRLKQLIEATIPCDLKESHVTRPHSSVITDRVVECARNAAPPENRGCIIYCLLVCLRWFKRQAKRELYDSELNDLRALACQIIAKKIIEGEEDEHEMMHSMLLKRYAILRNGKETHPSSALERAVDLHATTIISSSGYQKCISYLYKGWIIQDPDDPSSFTNYKAVANTKYWAHYDHERMRAPVYQNAFQILVSFLYLALYSIAINTVNPGGDIDFVEGLFMAFTFGFILDEAVKIWKVGRWYLGFLNAFNLTLYATLTVSFFLRAIALFYEAGSDQRQYYQVLAYNFLAVCAPMVWCRMLLFLDTIQFFGAMLVVLKVMMKESLIFFALLVVIIAGFLQAFIGLDNSDNVKDTTTFILKAMVGGVLQSPEFDGFEDFAHPFGLVLYYMFTFIVMVILLNILIALYNQAYTDITENANDEYMALFAHKTIQFVRAPDENVFIPPLNIIEIFCLILPLELWMNRRKYAHLNDKVMKVVYSPFLLAVAWFEVRQARWVAGNRARGEEDDDRQEEWEELQGDASALQGQDEWLDKVQASVPCIEEDMATQEVKKLEKKVEILLKELKALRESIEGDSGKKVGGSESGDSN